MSKKPRSAGIYCRISSDPRGLALGVQRQEEDCRALAATLGWTVERVFVDNDVSASKGLRRPEYEALKDAVEAGEVDGILVYNIDRLTRRLSELASFLDWRRVQGVPFATTEGDNTETANGVFVLQVKGAIAQQEAERISERVARAFAAQRAKGIPASGGRPFGYEPGGRVIRADEALAIADGATMILAGHSPGAVAREWETRGVKPVRAERWDRTTVRGIYLSPRVAGLVAHKGEIVGEGDFEAILDRPTWEAVKNILDGEKRPGANTRVHLLSGFMFCGLCGARLVTQVTHRNRPGAKSHGSYACVSDRGGCGKIRRNKKWVDDWVDGYVTGVLSTMEPVEIDEDEEREADALDAEIAATEQRITETREAYEAGTITGVDYFPLLSSLRATVNGLLSEQADNAKRKAQEAEGINPLLVWQAGSLEARRALLSELVQGFYVHRLGNIGRAPIPPDSITAVEA